MVNRFVVVSGLALLLIIHPHQAFAAAQQLTVRWSDLGPAVSGRTIALVVPAASIPRTAGGETTVTIALEVP